MKKIPPKTPSKTLPVAPAGSNRCLYSDRVTLYTPMGGNVLHRIIAFCTAIMLHFKSRWHNVVLIVRKLVTLIRNCYHSSSFFYAVRVKVFARTGVRCRVCFGRLAPDSVVVPPPKTLTTSCLPRNTSSTAAAVPLPPLGKTNRVGALANRTDAR